MWTEDEAFKKYTAERVLNWDKAASAGREKRWPRYYRNQLARTYRFCIPEGASVLELGCGRGDLIASLKPSAGVGVDFSPEMIKEARKRHPNLKFICCDAHSIDIEGKFDFIIMSDLLNDAWDVQQVLTAIRPLCHNETRLIFNFFSHLWRGPLNFVRRLGLANPTLQQNWLTREDMTNLLYLSGYEVFRSWPEFLTPFNIPLLSGFSNKCLAKIWPFKSFDLANFMIARPLQSVRQKWKDSSPTVSVLVAARNEAGNIGAILDRVPEMGGGTEIIFVEGNSTDNTYDVIENAIKHTSRNCVLYKQAGKGKGDAVRTGFAKAKGDILMILDADITVPPEDLPKFYDVIYSGQAEFVNGVRLVYPMEKRAMRFFNLLGNKFFSGAFSWLLGQTLRDSLCGTKVLTRLNYERIVQNRSYFGDFDPFGDFDLLFGAAKLNLRIVDMPVRYRDRVYGETNIQRWRHGWMLLKMVACAAFKIKFV
ncbi:MAG: glycosyltransferase [Synergistaceae bacterium]|jgi:ubiquinone/menaquinone biosynthesis C-methylase UbiE|nr:glycosyltransferase [Synergistaceae bacterium]